MRQYAACGIFGWRDAIVFAHARENLLILMLFHSPVFLFWFLPLALFGGAVLKRHRMIFLLVSSYVFYMWWNPLFLPLLIASTLLNFWIGKRVARGASKASGRRWMTAGILLNLLLLGFFKYQLMIAETVTGLTGIAVPTVRIGLPLAISFFTFEGISYLVDVYKGAKSAKNFLAFGCFMSFFPHLIAGPIIRFPAIAPQLAPPPLEEGLEVEVWSERAEGAYRFILGLGKKVLMADTLALIADPIFKNGPGSMTEAWLGLLAYTFQIYLDFSSYTDMAIGVGLLFGIRLPENFDTPYLAVSITDFWRRWHITLSSWIRDYLYIPLGGSRRSPLRVGLNLILVMTLAGLWHGAAWTFVLWGLYYGILLALERFVLLDVLNKLPVTLQRCWAFLLVMFGWVLFRSQSIADAGAYFSTMVGGRWGDAVSWWMVAPVAVGALWVLCERRVPRKPSGFSLPLGVGFAILTCAVVLIALGSEGSPFIYFQF